MKSTQKYATLLYENLEWLLASAPTCLGNVADKGMIEVEGKKQTCYPDTDRKTALGQVPFFPTRARSHHVS